MEEDEMVDGHCQSLTGLGRLRERHRAHAAPWP